MTKRSKSHKSRKRLHPAAERENYIRNKKELNPEAEGSSLVTGTTGTATPAVTSNDGEQEKGVGSLLRDPPLVRSDLRMLRAYMGCGTFTEEQIEGMMTVMGGIVAKGNNRERIAAFRTLLSQAKLSWDMAEGRTQHIHTHAHVHTGTINGIGEDLLAIAADLGIPCDPAAFDRDADFIEAGETRPRQAEEIERGAPGGGHVSS